jgi:hypothetical protein
MHVLEKPMGMEVKDRQNYYVDCTVLGMIILYNNRKG